MIVAATLEKETCPGSPLFPVFRSKDKRCLEKHAALARDGYVCQLCGLDFLDRPENLILATVDHVVPRCAGGTNDLSNLIAVCATCNALKAGIRIDSIDEARQLVATRRARLLAGAVVTLTTESIRQRKEVQQTCFSIATEAIVAMLTGQAMMARRVLALVQEE